jgi:hypothetical protein
MRQYSSKVSEAVQRQGQVSEAVQCLFGLVGRDSDSLPGGFWT